MTEASARPARPEGSTIRTIVALNFVSAPTTDALRESLSLHDRMRDRYPRRQELRATTVAVNPGAMATGMNAGELVGFAFDYSKPDGAVKQAMGCADKAVYIQRTDCPDSAKVQREVQEEYELVLPVWGETWRTSLWSDSTASCGTEHAMISGPPTYSGEKVGGWHQTSS